MAFVRYKQPDSYGHICATMTHQQAVELQKVMKGLIQGSPRQKQFAANVESIYFGKGQQGASTAVSEQVQELWQVPERKDIDG